MGSINATNGAMSSWNEQQRRIQQLEAENAELRRQLDDLRRGVGVALVIHGRAIPLAAQPPSYPSQPDSARSGAAPHALSSLSPTRASTPYDAPFTAAARPPHAPPQPSPFPEDAWLSDSGSTLMSPPLTASARQGTSSQDMTPSWLREHPHGQPAPRASARMRSVPNASRIEQAPMRTLAEITGHHQAVRQRAPLDRRTPYSDSFVLE